MNQISIPGFPPAPKRRPFKLTAPVPLENDLHFAVWSALRVLVPNEAVVTTWAHENAASAAEGARRKRLGAQPGWPDLGVFWSGRAILLELKREKHGKLSPVQRRLHARLAEVGFPVAVCRSVEEALQAVEAAGVPLRGRLS